MTGGGLVGKDSPPAADTTPITPKVDGDLLAGFGQEYGTTSSF